MIKYNPKSWLHLIFALHKSDTLKTLWKEIIYIGVFTLAINYVVLNYYPSVVLDKLFQVFSLVGFVISLLLVFRTNTAYDRWWEGRKKWGELVNDTRNFGAKLSVLVTGKEERAFFTRMIPNFVFATKEHLREAVKFEELELTEEENKILISKTHVPLAIVKLIYNKLVQLKSMKQITEEDFIILDTNCNALMNSLGACERIKNTPIPFSYSLFIKKFIFVYVTTLPLAFVTTFGYFSALIATFIFYILVSMEVLAEEIEDPFGKDDNDLPTDSLCEKIKLNIHEVFSEN
jgi:ion channel-forming bestrophin family protein